MKTKILILLSIIIASASEGDMNLTTPDGRVIILHEDGTWEYKPVTNLVPIEWNTNCKYTKNKIDDFSGEKMRVTKSIFLGKSDIKKKLYFYYSSISDENGNTIFLNFTGFGDLGCLTPTSSKVILKFEDCSVSKPSGIKEINPVRDFLLNLKQKRKSNESTFKSRETYKRNTT